MRVFVLGSTGMLGRYVYTYLNSKGYDVVSINRNSLNALNVTNEDLKELFIRRWDVVINCMGLIKQRKGTSPSDFIKVNALFPHVVSDFCSAVGAKFIQVSTDCVFSGLEGHYNEDSPHDATDIYGRTKSLGEPELATIIRTSIIGEELTNGKSLLEWVRSNKGGTVGGYTNHHWNGITCLQFAKICDFIIRNNCFWKGVKIINSPKPINKHDLVKLISRIYGLDITVLPHQTETKCDRTLLSTRKDIVMVVPELQNQIVEMKVFGPTLRGE